MSYHEFRRPCPEHETTNPSCHECAMGYGSFEVFQVPGPGTQNSDREPGWYWWPCFPGCMPDGDAVGPFETEKEAIDDANSK